MILVILMRKISWSSVCLILLTYPAPGWLMVIDHSSEFESQLLWSSLIIFLVTNVIDSTGTKSRNLIGTTQCRSHDHTEPSFIQVIQKHCPKERFFLKDSAEDIFSYLLTIIPTILAKAGNLLWLESLRGIFSVCLSSVDFLVFLCLETFMVPKPTSPWKDLNGTQTLWSSKSHGL